MERRVSYTISDDAYKLVGKYSAMSGLRKSDFIDELVKLYSEELYLYSEREKNVDLGEDVSLDNIFDERTEFYDESVFNGSCSEDEYVSFYYNEKLNSPNYD